MTHAWRARPSQSLQSPFQITSVHSAYESQGREALPHSSAGGTMARAHQERPAVPAIFLLQIECGIVCSIFPEALVWYLRVARLSSAPLAGGLMGVASPL